MKKIIYIILICCILSLSSCFSTHNYPIREGKYVPEVDKELKISVRVNKNNDIKEINIKLVYIKIDEISKEEYDAAEGYNVIEDFSLKEESRKYYSLTILCVVDNVEYELVTFGVGKKGNLREIYQMSFTSEFGIGEIWLFNYEDYLRIDFNSPDDIKLFKEDSK